jgi:hypothetical protein
MDAGSVAPLQHFKKEGGLMKWLTAGKGYTTAGIPIKRDIA